MTGEGGRFEANSLLRFFDNDVGSETSKHINCNFLVLLEVGIYTLELGNGLVARQE